MISAATPEDLDEFCARLEIARGPDMRGMKLVTERGIEALVAFDYWTPNSAQMHVWCGGQLTRRFLYELFTYLFVTNDKGIAITVIPCDNTASLDISQRVGFRVVHEILDGWAPGTSMVIQELRKHECIWLRGQHGKKLTPSGKYSSRRLGSTDRPTSRSANGQSGHVSFGSGPSSPE